ncbi:hypothetical protein E4U42_004559 [Claviceps africana]|uniref:Uncharacterized protein n=1 Tax=Claviceps africana TaxID=83212 RepID=A0A8K0J4U4_9HYPO|nr:hypothetical protein E4U42_004559 [Claviceps africana]
MVSFFGLKLGSDRKKSQTKTQVKTPVKTSHTLNSNDLNVISEDQSFDPPLSPPQFTPSAARPGTANSMRDSSNWRAVFKNRSMTSSMVDLAGPRRRQPSVGSLRCAASDMNLRSSTALPAALGGGGGGVRPGIPSRPATSNKADWVNPLDVHFCKDSARSPLGTPHEPKPSPLAASPAQKAKSSPGARKRLPASPGLASNEAGDGGKDKGYASLDHAPQSGESHVIRNGYPSPPQSDRNSERAFSPVHCANSDGGVASSNKRNPSSSLRQVELPGAKPLPSPDVSLPGTSEERKVVPVIRTVPVRRETIAFHQPRGRSLTMEFEREQLSAMTQPPKEGFSGNFADFDFGESVTKIARSTSVQADRSSPKGGARCNASPIFGKDAFLSPMTHVSPSREQIYAAQQSESERSMAMPPASPAPTQASDDQITSSSLIDQLPEPPRESIRRPGSPSSAAPDVHRKPSQGFLSSRFHSDMSSRAPPPRPLQPVTAARESTYRLEAEARSPWDPRPGNGSSSSDVREEMPPSMAEVIPPSSPFTRRPLEGKFGVSNGLPRGRRPEPPPQEAPAKSALDNEEGEELWPVVRPVVKEVGRSALRQSALPAPLTPSPARMSHFASPGASPGASPLGSPLASPLASSLGSPLASPLGSPLGSTGASTSPSGTAPRLPSPTFTSLAEFMSSPGSFSFEFEEQLNPPTMGGSTSMSRQPSTSAVGNARRAKAQQAPSTPTLATLPS